MSDRVTYPAKFINAQGEVETTYVDVTGPLIRWTKVPLEAISEQRQAGWPDFHPEDYCHRCGGQNSNWYTSREVWSSVFPNYGDDAEYNGILCIPCFMELAQSTSWHIRRDDIGSWVLEVGRMAG